MKLEPDRPRLDVPHPGQQQGREHFAVGQPATNPRGDFLEHPLARRIFQQADERFDLRVQPNQLRLQLRFGGGDRAKLRQKAEVTQSRQRGGSGGQLEESPSLHHNVPFGG